MRTKLDSLFDVFCPEYSRRSRELTRIDYRQINRVCGELAILEGKITNHAEIEDQLERTRKRIRDLQRDFASLSGWAKSVASTEIERRRGVSDLDRAIDPPPRHKWPNIALPALLDEWFDGLEFVATKIVTASPPRKGRKKNIKAYRAAELCLEGFVLSTGKEPTFWNGGDTEFSRVVCQVFEIMEIDGGIRGPIEAAMQKHFAGR